MRVLCRHGHFAFYPRNAGEVARFTQYFGIQLESVEDFYTFPLLVDAPKFSLVGLPYLAVPALETFEGEPWEVMRANGFVYDVKKETLVRKETVLIQIAPPLLSFYYLAQTPLIQPGSRNSIGRQVLSFDGEYSVDILQLRLSEFGYE